MGFSPGTISSPPSHENTGSQVAYDSIAGFWLVIPPRVSLASREVAGSIHIRWEPEIVEGSWQWVMHINGHLFDEIGAAVLNLPAENIEAWAMVNQTRVPLVLDRKGHFEGRYVAGAVVDSQYEIVLCAKTLDDGAEHEVDYRSETELMLFSPWNRLFR